MSASSASNQDHTCYRVVQKQVLMPCKKIIEKLVPSKLKRQKIIQIDKYEPQIVEIEREVQKICEYDKTNYQVPVKLLKEKIVPKFIINEKVEQIILVKEKLFVNKIQKNRIIYAEKIKQVPVFKYDPKIQPSKQPVSLIEQVVKLVDEEEIKQIQVPIVWEEYVPITQLIQNVVNCQKISEKIVFVCKQKEALPTPPIEEVYVDKVVQIEKIVIIPVQCDVIVQKIVEQEHMRNVLSQVQKTVCVPIYLQSADEKPIKLD